PAAGYSRRAQRWQPGNLAASLARAAGSRRQIDATGTRSNAALRARSIYAENAHAGKTLRHVVAARLMSATAQECGSL
ncbi:hypothetical protein GEV936_22480, partial [Xanthomonas perforans]